MRDFFVLYAHLDLKREPVVDWLVCESIHMREITNHRYSRVNPTGGTRKKVRLNGGFFVSISLG